MLAAATAFALNWAAAVSAQSSLNDFRQEADRAYSSAMGGATHCDKGTVMRARADITRMLAEIDKIGKKAKKAGSYGTDEAELRLLQSYLQGIGDSIDKMQITGCDEMFRAFGTPPKAKPKEEPKPTTEGMRNPYAPQPSEVEKQRYEAEVKVEFDNIADARERGDCPGWEAALARLTALLNNYRMSAVISADRIVWADRLARERSQRPRCSEIEPARPETGQAGQPSVGPEPVYTEGYQPDRPPPEKKDGAKPAEPQPNPAAAKEEEKKRKRPR